MGLMATISPFQFCAWERSGIMPRVGHLPR